MEVQVIYEVNRGWLYYIANACGWIVTKIALSVWLAVSYFPIVSFIQGVLELGFNPESTTSRDWKSRLFVLKHDPKTKRATLDFYKDTKKRWQKQVAKGLISLWPTFRLSLAHMSSYKFPIKLVTSDRQIFCLAAPDFQMMNVWYNKIQSQLSLDNLFPDKKGGCENSKFIIHDQF